MAKSSSSAAASAAASASEPEYFEVSLNKIVDVQGHRYLPGEKIIADAATVSAMGDAVANKRPVSN